MIVKPQQKLWFISIQTYDLCIRSQEEDLAEHDLKVTYTKNNLDNHRWQNLSRQKATISKTKCVESHRVSKDKTCSF